MTAHHGWMQRIVQVFLTGHLSPLLLLVSLGAGAIALLATPREEDPQIVVPVAEILVAAPGASALEVERQITIPIERVVRGISGVEDVYSMSSRGRAVVTARFYVGENREDSLVKLHTTLQQHAAAMPPQARSWRVDTISIDDVPILAITLHSSRVDDHGLRRIAEEVVARLQQVDDAGPATIHGGRARRLCVRVDPTALAGRALPFSAIEHALAAASTAATAGTGTRGDRTILVEAAPIAPDAAALRDVVIGSHGGQPVHLGDVATVADGPEEPESYVWMLGGAARGRANVVPENAVTIAIAKRRGANAVGTSERLRERMTELARELLPADVQWTVTRDSGATADAKVDELLEGLLVAVAIVVVLITMMLGWRAAIVVALAVPITFGLTLLVNLLGGYSINRVTLFALILSLGLVVDDPIVDVENIHRHLQRRDRPPLQAVLDAVDEVRPPVIVATLAVVLSFLPLFFITGMMGPYMRPMALNVPVAMAMSMLVAFTLTPWLSHLLLRSAPHGHGGQEADDAHPAVQRAY
ncbi:MAG: efflux RND transporter permease subunit, partial [Planctomycetes bacterium]|nr:efflux RND transporter permease subunit [Planctomycetota bacterium]